MARATKLAPVDMTGAPMTVAEAAAALEDALLGLGPIGTAKARAALAAAEAEADAIAAEMAELQRQAEAEKSADRIEACEQIVHAGVANIRATLAALAPPPWPSS